MKRIAIFVSGAGNSAERIVKLFNEGNRLKTEIVVTDDSAVDLLQRLQGEDVSLIHVPDSEWHAKGPEIASLIREKEINLLVLDDFAMSVSDEIMEAVDGEVLRVSSPELAPREVVAALEADLRKPVQEEKPEEKPDETPSLENEWAQSLKIQYTPPKIPTTPPQIPDQNTEKENLQPDAPQGFGETNPWYAGQAKNYQEQNYRARNYRREESDHGEPMPSTWLIWSILATVFCCFIPGIIAIIFSSQVSSRFYAGDIKGAKRASRYAEIWIIVSVVLGVIAATLYLPFMLLGW